jgi:hypothetical protein
VPNCLMALSLCFLDAQGAPPERTVQLAGNAKPDSAAQAVSAHHSRLLQVAHRLASYFGADARRTTYCPAKRLHADHRSTTQRVTA